MWTWEAFRSRSAISFARACILGSGSASTPRTFVPARTSPRATGTRSRVCSVTPLVDDDALDAVHGPDPGQEPLRDRGLGDDEPPRVVEDLGVLDHHLADAHARLCDDAGHAGQDAGARGVVREDLDGPEVHERRDVLDVTGRREALEELAKHRRPKDRLHRGGDHAAVHAGRARDRAVREPDVPRVHRVVPDAQPVPHHELRDAFLRRISLEVGPKAVPHCVSPVVIIRTPWYKSMVYHSTEFYIPLGRAVI